MQNLIKNGLSLKTQLYGLLVLLAVLSFSGRLYFNIQSTKSYFQEQMSSHAQDAATSLGLSISPYMDDENIVIADTMVSAIFDSGYYASIEMKGTNNEIIFTRKNPLEVTDVPTWFINLIDLDAPVMTSEVNNGWNIAGTLYVQSHAGVSYIKMWDYLKKSIYGSLFIIFICFIVAYFILKAVFKPLDTLEAQAAAVSKKQFKLNPKIPFTKELRKVTSAMNNMVSNLEKTFTNLNDQSERLNKEVYLDSLTGLGNRKAFETYFYNTASQLMDNDRYTLCMITLPSLQTINNDLGYQEGDNYVTSAARKIQTVLDLLPEHRLFRLAGGTFVALLHYPSFATSETLSPLGLYNKNIGNRYTHGFLTLTYCEFGSEDKLTDLLSKLDTSNTVVQQTHPESFQSNSGYSVSKWREIIDALINDAEIEFSFQPIKVKSENGETEYFEVFSQLIYQDERISNVELFAMADRLGKTLELDKKLIKSFIQIKEFHNTRKFALNLSRETITNDEFIEWLSVLAQAHPILTYNLIFEVKEASLVSDIEKARQHIDDLKSINIGVCIEHFGTSSASFKYLKGLDVEFVKLDASFTNDLESNSQSEFFVSTVTHICHGFGIQVIGCQIEDDYVFEKLKELGFDGFQGKYIQGVQKISTSTNEQEFVSGNKLLSF